MKKIKILSDNAFPPFVRGDIVGTEDGIAEKLIAEGAACEVPIETRLLSTSGEDLPTECVQILGELGDLAERKGDKIKKINPNP